MEGISSEMLTFCKEISEADLKKLPFQKARFEGISNAWLANQARCYQMAKTKIPTWWANGNLIFPDPQALEQCTSEWVARWKQSLVPDWIETLVDLTAGLGVDAYFLGKGLKNRFLIETSVDRAKLLNENLSALGLSETRIETLDALSFLRQKPDLFSSTTMVYVDPDRRGEVGQRLVSWKESEPSLFEVVNLLKNTGSWLLAKLSPLDDPTELMRELPGIQSVFTISLHNEVKEILLFFNFSARNEIVKQYAVEISRSGFYRKVEVSSKSEIPGAFGHPELGHFFYDPWASIRKSYQTALLPAQYPATLFSPHSQLFVAKEFIPDFPGRAFQIKYKLSSLKAFGLEWAGKAISVITRGKAESAENIKKKFKLKEGGNQYLLCLQGVDNQTCYFLATRIETEWRPQLWQPLPG